MNLLSYSLVNANHIYPGFIQGSETDLDTIARSTGCMPGHKMVGLSAFFSKDKSHTYELQISFDTQGEQKIRDLPDYAEASSRLNIPQNVIEDSISYAMKNKVSSEEHVITLSKIFKEYPEVLDDTCWYEGSVTLIEKDLTTKESSILINSTYESNLGLNGVYGSIQEITDYFTKSDNLIDYVTYLIEKD